MAGLARALAPAKITRIYSRVCAGSCAAAAPSGGRRRRSAVHERRRCVGLPRCPRLRGSFAGSRVGHRADNGRPCPWRYPSVRAVSGHPTPCSVALLPAVALWYRSGGATVVHPHSHQHGGGPYATCQWARYGDLRLRPRCRWDAQCCNLTKVDECVSWPSLQPATGRLCK